MAEMSCITPVKRLDIWSSRAVGVDHREFEQAIGIDIGSSPACKPLHQQERHPGTGRARRNQLSMQSMQRPAPALMYAGRYDALFIRRTADARLSQPTL